MEIGRTVKVFTAIEAGTNNIPATFTTGAGSMVFEHVVKCKKIVIQSYVPGWTKWNYTHGEPDSSGVSPAVGSAPVSGDVQFAISPSGSMILDDPQQVRSLFVRGYDGVISSGRIAISAL